MALWIGFLIKVGETFNGATELQVSHIRSRWLWHGCVSECPEIDYHIIRGPAIAGSLVPKEEGSITQPPH
jgi:hypothetical protein